MIFRRMPRPENPLLIVLREIREAIRDNNRQLRTLKEQTMASKQEVLDALADVKNLLVETSKDVTRVADKLDQAVTNNDLTDVQAAVAELRSLAQGIDARAEQSDPEPATQPEQPAEPTA